MHLRAFACVLAVVLQFVYASPPQSGTKVCSGVVQGLCSQDFDVIGSTFGIILPPQNPKRSSPFEDDLIYKMVQALPYGSAGMASTESNGTLHFVTAVWYFNNRVVIPTTPGISMINSTIRAQVMVNGTSHLTTSAFALQSPSAGQVIPCNISVSPLYLYTKQQITAYVRLQGCQIIRTAIPTTVDFFRTDAAPIYSGAGMESATFPLDNTMKMGSVLIDDINKIRVSTESYNAALSDLQLNYK